MRSVDIILGPVARIVKRAWIRWWLWRERRAKRLMARSFNHVHPRERHRKPAKSDALHKAPIIRLSAGHEREYERYQVSAN